jgi:hypothetical protein
MQVAQYSGNGTAFMRVVKSSELANAMLRCQRQVGWAAMMSFFACRSADACCTFMLLGQFGQYYYQLSAVEGSGALACVCRTEVAGRKHRHLLLLNLETAACMVGHVAMQCIVVAA